MIDPTWFFSTLAQATAASIGFVIAFSAALYQSRKSRKRERVDEFKRDIRDYRGEVADVIAVMAREISDSAEFEKNRDIYDREAPGNEISGDIREWGANVDATQSAILWAHLRWFQSLLRQIRIETDLDEMERKFADLEHAVLGILTTFKQGHDKVSETEEVLFREIREDAEYNPNSRIFTTFPETRSYLEKKGRHVDDNSMKGWRAIADEIADTYYFIDSSKYFDTDLFQAEPVKPIIRRCKRLFGIGVLAPTALLLTVPESLLRGVPTYLITISQLAILFATGYYSLELFNYLLEQMSGTEY